MRKTVEFAQKNDEEAQFMRGNAERVNGRTNACSPHTDARTFSDEEVGLVKKLFLQPRVAIPHTVAFCGVEGADDANNVTLRVAQVLALKINKQVCLIDLRSVSRRTSGRNEIAVDDYRESISHAAPSRDPIQKGSIPNLWFMTCSLESSGISLSPEHINKRLKELRADFDFVLIRTAAVTESNDAVQIAQLADGLVLVVRANSTHRETARKVKESLQSANVTLLGAVLTNRSFPIPVALYRRL